MRRIPFRHEPHGTREKPRFKDTDEESRDEETSVGFRDAAERHADSPGSHQDADVEAGSAEFGEEHVGRDFAQDVGDEENH